MDPTSTAPIILEPQGQVQSAVIWLHGLGADGEDFVGVVPQLDLPEEHGIRFVFPHAPYQEVTINGGATMRAWYDIRSMDLMGEVDAAGIRVACYQVYDLVQQQIRAGIAPQRIVLAGFSQGGLIALHAGLSYQQALGGILALSTYCPMYEQFYMHRHMPIMMTHGLSDPVIPLPIADQSRKALEHKGYHVEWHTYPMQHQVCAEELDDISHWLRRVLQLDGKR
ncbi:alpha/beta hydrolase fold domain-containing protein [Thiomicrorhabdus sp. zzn3]|uniref:alpha/beta hydrolase n=1 Tax=Thiomicrorhabdus sp. zzn3 TaxID=3039775 RepID=UPI0024368533|nr:alpha/beta hydrolase fold domain-containing protein [Thiomicrorhabdus sp. zzn3]MDG6777188.1 alpha/beta hydrolase fold domain-containing protein [Thiomicrorhabdus sp. zzn3]